VRAPARREYHFPVSSASPHTESSIPLPAPKRSGRPAGTLYRGREGMWSWVAHRITGVLTFFFLFAHVLDTALVRVSPESYDKVIDTYKNPFVNLMEIGLVGAVLFHALNGLRIIAIDFWAKGPRLQRQMLWAIIVVWVVVMVPGAFFMFKHSFESIFGSA
jgi:succinate dehydrogenase / fumarate reductase cytochrome b subunit